MKTKTFLLLCLFLGIGLTQLSAQQDELNDRGTGTIILQGTTDISGPVYCDGIEVDFLVGNALDYQLILFAKNGSIYKGCATLKGEMISTTPPYENFKYSEFDKMDGTTGYFKTNLIGNLGTHYVSYMLLTYDNQVILVRTNCPGSDK